MTSKPRQNHDEIFFQEMKAVLKPMINSALLEKPKDPVSKMKIIFVFIYKLI